MNCPKCNTPFFGGGCGMCIALQEKKTATPLSIEESLGNSYKVLVELSDWNYPVMVSGDYEDGELIQPWRPGPNDPPPPTFTIDGKHGVWFEAADWKHFYLTESDWAGYDLEAKIAEYICKSLED